MNGKEFVPGDRTRGLVSVAIGVLLVFNPLFLDAVGLGEEQYTYTAAGIAPGDDQFAYQSELPDEIERVRDIECFFERPVPVGCLAQGTLLDGENHTAELAEAYSSSFYSYVRLDDEFYRRYYRGESVGEQRTQVTVRYESVDSRTVLEEVSVGLDYFEDDHRSVVRRGQLTTDRPFRFETRLGPNTYSPTGLIVQAQGEYYLVGLDEYEPPLEYRWLYSFCGVAIGLLAVWYGARRSRPGR